MSILFLLFQTLSFISLTFLILLAEAFNATLNKSGDSGHSCLVPDIKGEVFNVSLLGMMPIGGFFLDILYQDEEDSFYS